MASFELPQTTEGSGWSFQLAIPPYDTLAITSFADLARKTLPSINVTFGALLIMRPVGTDVEQQCTGFELIINRLPWLATVVMPPQNNASATHCALLTRVARRGATIVLPCGNPMRSIIEVMQNGTEPDVQVAGWITRALPRWKAPKRDSAAELFALGFQFDPELMRVRGELPRRLSAWTLAGRATRAAVTLQRMSHSGISLSQIALDAGYSDARAMEKAILRIFGVRPRDIKRTLGWEWLMWRFLSGYGSGKLSIRAKMT